MSDFPLKEILSPFFKSRGIVLKRINVSFWFSNSIVILLFEYFVVWIVPSRYFVVCVRNINVRIPRRERIRNNFPIFILFGIQLYLCLSKCVRVR